MCLWVVSSLKNLRNSRRGGCGASTKVPEETPDLTARASGAGGWPLRAVGERVRRTTAVSAVTGAALHGVAPGSADLWKSLPHRPGSHGQTCHCFSFLDHHHHLQHSSARGRCKQQTASVSCTAFFRQEAASHGHRVELGVNKGHTCSCTPPACSKTNEPPLPRALCSDNSYMGLLHGATGQALSKPISHLFETRNIW